MPFLVVEDTQNEAAAGGALENTHESVFAGVLEMVNRGCHLKDTKDILIKKMPTFNISGRMIAYASPDSTYAVTKKLLAAAQQSVLIGIYDFTASYVKEILLNLMARGVKVSLMLDLDGVKGENALFEELGQFGAETVPAPSCASRHGVNYFSSSHEKVIIIDDTWVLVQSGNYSNNSIPFNETDGGDPAHFVKGNRDMGIALESPQLAAFFTKVLRGDMQLELSALEAVASSPKEFPLLVETVPPLLPETLFKSKNFTPAAPIKVTPVLSPDNYMKTIPDFLKSAKKSIYIEQQYIRSSQSDIITLLAAVKSAVENNDVTVKIILGKIFDQKDIPKEQENLANLESNFGLRLGDHIRYIDTKRFVHCHNKLIVIDDEKVLISSQNWSNSAVSKNREAGLILEYPELAKYYSKIFASDWKTALSVISGGGGEPETIGSIEAAKGRYTEVSIGDYLET